MKIFGKAAIAVGLAGAMVMGVAGIAVAAPAPTSLGQVGSDTTYFAMDKIATDYNATTTKIVVTEVPPVMGGIFPNQVTVPADADCAAQTYNAGNPPPNGSSAGITALVADGTNGCVDFARSSRGRGGSDPSNLQFVAFALDAVTWSYNTNNTHHVTNLTRNNLVDIFTCDASTHAPFVSNWSQLPGGKAGPIVKYAPQLGSGTLSFFQTKLLNGHIVDENCDAAHMSTRIEENEGTQIAPADRPNAIFPYSFAKWTSQNLGHESDVRAGALLGKVEGVKASKSNINEKPTRFVGTRYVYNVLKTNEPEYAKSISFAGVDSTHNGYICNGKAGADIAFFGFVKLLRAPQGTGLPQGVCRVEPTPL